VGEEIISFDYGDSERSEDMANIKIKWNGRNKKGDLVSPGLYFYVIRSNYGKKVGKMVIIR
jgi:hypothetical protein